MRIWKYLVFRQTFNHCFNIHLSHIFSFTFTHWNSFEERVSMQCYILNKCLFFNIWNNINSYFIQWIIINNSHFSFWCSHCPDLASGSSFELASVFFYYVSTILWTFFYFLMEQDVSGSSCPFFEWKQPFSQEIWFLQMENDH